MILGETNFEVGTNMDQIWGHPMPVAQKGCNLLEGRLRSPEEDGSQVCETFLHCAFCAVGLAFQLAAQKRLLLGGERLGSQEEGGSQV